MYSAFICLSLKLHSVKMDLNKIHFFGISKIILFFIQWQLSVLDGECLLEKVQSIQRPKILPLL